MDIDGDDSDEVLYNVLYEDGDTADMGEEECRKAIDLYMRLESGEINEWEIGGDEYNVVIRSCTYLFYYSM